MDPKRKDWELDQGPILVCPLWVTCGHLQRGGRMRYRRSRCP